MDGETLIGLGLDLGGSGLRVASFARDDGGRLVPRGFYEGPARMEDAASGVEQLLADQNESSATPLPLGMAAPGIKTADGRGIDRARYLAATSDSIGELQQHLLGRGLDRIVMPHELASDALAALLGEVVVRGGLLEGVENAFFIGPGSGLAEGMLLQGEVQRLAGPCAAELPATREEDIFGDLEEECSLAGLVRSWNETGSEATPAQVSIETAAEAGHVAAREQLERFAKALASLIEHRAPELERLRQAAGGAPPALLVRTRRGRFFASPAVQAIVVPVLREAASGQGATLVLPRSRASIQAACAGALALCLRSPSAPALP